MKILVTGSTGLVGRALVRALVKEGHSVCRLVRPETNANDNAGGFNVAWNPATGELGGAAVGPDAVVNLAGAPIGDGRWTAKRKEELRESRVGTTRALIQAIEKMNVKPSVFISASAIGYYGNRGDEELSEESAAGDGFLAEIAREWEAEALKAETWRTRVVLARLGIVLAKQGGALAKMLTPFRMGLGGRLGSGKQWMSWVALEDVVGILKLCLERTPIQGAVDFAPISGPVNVVSPQPVTNAEFTKMLASAVHRPAIFPVPPIALRLALGREMADALLMASQRVVPGKLKALGYAFRYSSLDSALNFLLRE
ncbi:MAG: TIGR01777 family oxidoreductase [Acidobacteria bacterium]|nr:TIGR01777 family oxidoreductase [Acidobacteriota bacterium]MBS1865344.1 TIGR01777 family oxidoreductase [Acidobacteriota bacterium]